MDELKGMSQIADKLAAFVSKTDIDAAKSGNLLAYFKLSEGEMRTPAGRAKYMVNVLNRATRLAASPFNRSNQEGWARCFAFHAVQLGLLANENDLLGAK